MNPKKVAVFLAALAVLSVSDFSLAAEAPRVRVAVLKDKKEVFVAVAGAYEIASGRTPRVLGRGRDMTARVTAVAAGFKIGSQLYATDSILFKPRKKAGITVNKRRYRGDIAVVRDAQGQLTVVNILDVESYVKGVLVHEISPHWPTEAIKAQAVAARTYVLYQAEVMKSKDYDVTADTSSQVYGGYLSEKSRTNRAVNFTAGEVLMHQGKIFPAYFHAACGGMTEAAGELWKMDIAPLSGGRACSFCASSPHDRWELEMPLSSVREKLGEKYLSSAIASIAVGDRTASGRVRTLLLTDEKGVVVVFPVKDFRSLLGADVLRSASFSVECGGGNVRFAGRGWGHGVGLCQWGAYGMARQGTAYRDILLFYYPGGEVMVLP